MAHIAKKVILAAIRGEGEAIAEVLHKYDAYITKLATLQTTDIFGHKHMIVNEDVKQEIREKLILELPKFRGLKK